MDAWNAAGQTTLLGDRGIERNHNIYLQMIFYYLLSETWW